MTLNHLVYLTSRKLFGFQAFKYLARKHPRILMYHRIVPDNGRMVGVSKSDFRQQMELIARRFQVVTVMDLVRWTRQGEPIPDNAVAITFDDGYQDFYDNAFPILKALGLPATIYVVTDFVDNSCWLWPDLIRESLNRLATKGRTRLQFGPLQLDLANGLLPCWNRIADHCLVIDDREKWQLLSHLSEDAQLDMTGPTPTDYAALSWDQLRKMGDNGISVGSHSCSHPILTQVTDEQLEAEVTLSKSRIEDELQREVNGFCYPNGMPRDFNHAVKQMVERAGYLYGITAFPSRKPLSDLYQVNRYGVTRGGAEFEKNLFGLTFLGLKDGKGPEGTLENTAYH